MTQEYLTDYKLKNNQDRININNGVNCLVSGFFSKGLDLAKGTFIDENVFASPLFKLAQ